MIYIIVAILLGVLVGLYMPYNLSATMVSYVAVAILAALDSVFGGLLANLNKKFNISVFMMGLCANAILAVFLTFIGNILGISLSFAVIIVFGVRIFNNLAMIRRLTVDKYFEKRARERERERLLKLESANEESETDAVDVSFSPEAEGSNREIDEELTEATGEDKQIFDENSEKTKTEEEK